MRGLMFPVQAAASGIGFTAATPKADAQISVDVGVAPDCPYGYYDIAPYNCAPTGYYGPELSANRCCVSRAGPRYECASSALAVQLPRTPFGGDRF